MHGLGSMISVIYPTHLYFGAIAGGISLTGSVTCTSCAEVPLNLEACKGFSS